MKRIWIGLAVSLVLFLLLNFIVKLAVGSSLVAILLDLLDV